MPAITPQQKHRKPETLGRLRPKPFKSSRYQIRWLPCREECPVLKSSSKPVCRVEILRCAFADKTVLPMATIRSTSSTVCPSPVHPCLFLKHRLTFFFT